MTYLGLEEHVVDSSCLEHSVERFREAGIRLPTFAELVDPETIDPAITRRLAAIDRDELHPLNLFRVHWLNDLAGRRVAVPDHLVLPPELTGVEARIVVLLGDRFPMIGAHKVLAAYACLAPRIVTGQFDPTRHRAIWPSTGNYCRGGVAISRLMGCRGVAVLPEGMSRERFDWLEHRVEDPAEDIVRTPGSESNVKEIYDECARLDRDPRFVIFNQFAEFGNYLVHEACTGRAADRVFAALAEDEPGLRLAAWVSATGSAGTLAAGDYLKDLHGSRVVAVEALECPTLLANGFGAHNIQGIGDKHVPLIHNVMNTDVVTAISDRSTDALDLLFNTETGRDYLERRRGVPAEIVARLGHLGLSSLCNMLAAIKTAKAFALGPRDVLLTVATDPADMYRSERRKTLARRAEGRFDTVDAAEVFGQHLLGTTTDHLLETSHADRQRIFNLGYFTWVEQQGLSIDAFEARRDPAYWRGLRQLLPRWDVLIEDFNHATGSDPA